jgi:hypothetical protein
VLGRLTGAQFAAEEGSDGEGDSGLPFVCSCSLSHPTWLSSILCLPVFEGDGCKNSQARHWGGQEVFRAWEEVQPRWRVSSSQSRRCFPAPIQRSVVALWCSRNASKPSNNTYESLCKGHIPEEQLGQCLVVVVRAKLVETDTVQNVVLYRMYKTKLPEVHTSSRHEGIAQFEWCPARM